MTLEALVGHVEKRRMRKMVEELGGGQAEREVPMKAYHWSDIMDEKHVVVIASSIGEARQLAREDLCGCSEWFGDYEWINNDPIESELPTVIKWDESE